MSRTRSHGPSRLGPSLAGVSAVALFTLFLSGLVACARGEDERLTVYAAASLQESVRESAGSFEPGEAGPRFNFAGSNQLARQLEAAPRADVFISASERWVERLQERGLTLPGSGRVLLSNRLVLVTNAADPAPVRRLLDLAGASYEQLVLADPSAVPAGVYARSLLESTRLGGRSLWELARERVLPARDVRAALAVVGQRGRTVGIVYRTDAMTTDRVRVVGVLDGPEAPEIRYVGVVLKGVSRAQRARALLEHLAGPGFRAFAARGFLQPGQHLAAP